MRQYALITVIHVVNDTVVTTKLEGYFGSVQQFDSGRTLISLLNSDGVRTEVWHGIGVQTVHIRLMETVSE